MFAATNLPSYKTSHFLSLKIVILLKTLLRFQNLSPAFLMQRDLTWFHLILKICSRLLESLYLFKTRPNLDDMQSASKLLTSIDKSLDFILVVRGWFFVCLMICNFIIDVFCLPYVLFYFHFVDLLKMGVTRKVQLKNDFSSHHVCLCSILSCKLGA